MIQPNGVLSGATSNGLKNINEICEEIFQVHKLEPIVAWWRKKYDDIRYDQAKEDMIKMGILSRKSTTTWLNTYYSDCDNYQQALSRWREENKSSYPGITVSGDNSGIISSGNQSFRLENSMKDITHKHTTPPKKKEATTAWYTSALFIYIIFPILTGVIVLFLAYLLGW